MKIPPLGFGVSWTRGNRILLRAKTQGTWFNGYIYGTEIARGLDVLKLLPSEFLSQNEIDAALEVASSVFNAQQQRRHRLADEPRRRPRLPRPARQKRCHRGGASRRFGSRARSC